MRNPSDDLTERVLQMLAAARTNPMTRDEVIERLTLSLRRHLRYLARRERSRHHTSYDDLLEGDLEAIAKAMVLLQGKERELSRTRKQRKERDEAAPQASSAR